MKSSALTIISFGAAFLAPIVLQAEGSSSRLCSAVDAQGVRHRGSDYIGRAPWMNDVVKTVTPYYPYGYRVRRIGGSGLFRATLNLNTGSVTNVTVLKSTQISLLDSSAINALRQWQWRPGRWKEIDIALTFAMSHGKMGLYIGSSPVPASR
jgi:TonB family protein